MDIIIFLIFFFLLLLLNNLFVIEGFDKSPPPPNPLPYPKGNGPPLSPPEIKAKISPKELNKDNTVSTSYCGCINMQTRTLYNENTNLLDEIKKQIDKLTTSANKIHPQVKQNQKNIAATKKDDYTMCCEAGPDKREPTAYNKDSINGVYGGHCRFLNKYDCPIPPKEEEEEEPENEISSRPTAEQIKNG